MAQIKFFKGGIGSSLPEGKHEGNIYVIPNEKQDQGYQLGDIYIDMNSQDRLRVNSSIEPEIKTVAEWRADNLDKQQSIAGKIYIYSDYYENDEENKEPGIKIGDGNAFIVDLPFLPAVRKNDPDFLNTRITAFMALNQNQEESETLILSY